MFLIACEYHTEEYLFFSPNRKIVYDYKNHQSDISGQIKNEENAIKKIGGKIIYTSDITFSSSNLLNKYGDIFSNLQKILIRRIKKKYNFLKIRKLIEAFKKVKILVIGETIIDQYVFCEALGKSGKEPILVLRDIKTEEYLGGAAAISRHLSQFCNEISWMFFICLFNHANIFCPCLGSYCNNYQ